MEEKMIYEDEIEAEKAFVKQFLAANIVSFKRGVPVFKIGFPFEKTDVFIFTGPRTVMCVDENGEKAAGVMFKKMKILAELKKCYKENVTLMLRAFKAKQAANIRQRINEKEHTR